MVSFDENRSSLKYFFYGNFPAHITHTQCGANDDCGLQLFIHYVFNDFFFDNESRGVAKPYYKSWKGGKGQKSISRIWRSCRAPISSKVLALKLKWNFQIRLYVHGKCLKYAHCTYFFHSVRKYFYLRTFGKRLTMITFVVILETNFFFASWTVKAHWTHFVRGKIRQQEKKVSLE